MALVEYEQCDEHAELVKTERSFPLLHDGIPKPHQSSTMLEGAAWIAAALISRWPEIVANKFLDAVAFRLGLGVCGCR